MLTRDRLAEVLTYDKDTGYFTRNYGSGGKAKGSVAGSTASHYGYVHICIDRKMYKAHRLAFLWMTGDFPVGEVDHLDGDRANNSWGNLREVTRSENSRNCCLRSDNNSGEVGVGYHKKRGQWRARIGHKHIGWFRSKEEAVLARAQHPDSSEYSPRHGKVGETYNNKGGANA